MKQFVIAIAGFAASMPVWADVVTKADRLLCSVGEVQLCVETGECFSIQPWDIDMPQFVVVDTKRKLLSTTPASGEDRSTPIASMSRDSDRLVIQGYEQGRAFSVIVNETIGSFSAAIARDGVSVAAFGSCTDSDRL